MSSSSTTSGHRIAPARPPRWKTILARAVSLVVVLAVGFGVWVAANRAEQQDCLNRAFQSSLDERGRATDDLVDAILTVNGKLSIATSAREQSADRREFAAEVGRVKAVRQVAADRTQDRTEADCG